MLIYPSKKKDHCNKASIKPVDSCIFCHGYEEDISAKIVKDDTTGEVFLQRFYQWDFEDIGRYYIIQAFISS